MQVNKSLVAVSILLLILCFACNSEQPETVPYVPVNIQINLGNPDFQDLAIDGGFVNVTGGAKGILIYRENSASYKAFERNCTFEPNGTCARIAMDSSLLFMIDTCCSSQFDFSGNIMSGPAAFNLVQYNTSTDGTYLYINN